MQLGIISIFVNAISDCGGGAGGEGEGSKEHRSQSILYNIRSYSHFIS